MSDKHETDLADMLGGRVMPGSGNGYANPMDVRVDEQRLAIDGKSTRTKTISVTREMIDKAKEQAQGYTPAIAMRWYSDDRLKTYEDWIAVPLDYLQELLARLNEVKLITGELEPDAREALYRALNGY